MRLLRLQTILAATDLSESSDACVETAARLAAEAGAVLHVIHVPASTAQDEAEVRRALERTGALHQQVKIHVVPGDPRSTIAPFADALDADVIVLGRHPPGTPAAGERPVGSTANAVMIAATMPCLVTSRRLMLPVRRTMVAMDGSDTSRGALIAAASWASALRERAKSGASLIALHVETGAATPSARTSIAEDLAALRQAGGDSADVSVDPVTLDSPDPIEAIARYAAELNPDLLVLGTRALGRPTHPALGSVAAAVMKRVELPVLLVPPAVWQRYARDIEPNTVPREVGARTQ